MDYLETLDYKKYLLYVDKKAYEYNTILNESYIKLEDSELSFMEGVLDDIDFRYVSESVASTMMNKLKEFIRMIVDKLKSFFKEIRLKMDTMMVRERLSANADKLAELLRQNPLQQNKLIPIHGNLMLSIAQRNILSLSAKLVNIISTSKFANVSEWNRRMRQIQNMYDKTMYKIIYDTHEETIFNSVLVLKTKTKNIDTDMENVEKSSNMILDSIDRCIFSFNHITENEIDGLSERISILQALATTVSKVAFSIEESIIKFVLILHDDIIGGFMRNGIIHDPSAWRV